MHNLLPKQLPCKTAVMEDRNISVWVNNLKWKIQSFSLNSLIWPSVFWFKEVKSLDTGPARGSNISNDYIKYLLESRSLVWLISRIIAHIFALIFCIFLLTGFFVFFLFFAQIILEKSWQAFGTRSTISCDPNMLKTESISNSYWENISYISIIWYSVLCNMSKWCRLLSFFVTVFCFCLNCIFCHLMLEVICQCFVIF